MSGVLQVPRGKHPPELPGGLPFAGHALDFYRNPVRLLQRGRDRFGEIFSFLLAGRRIAVLTGPRANEAFFRARDDQLSARAAYQFTVPIFGKGVAYDAPPEHMSEQLDLIVPALTERRLRAYAEFIDEEVQTYLDRWGDEGEVDLLEVTNELTVFVASRCLIGPEFRKNVSTEFARLYHDLEGGINPVAFFWPNLPLPSFRRRDRARVRMVEVITRIVAARRASGIENEDFLQTLMTARYANGTALSDDTITGMLLTLIFAGQHTSAVLAAWTGIELLRHPLYGAQVLVEQEEILGTEGKIRFEALREMELLERAVREAERLHPPLVMLMRKIIGPFSYQDYTLPVGWLAMVSPAVSHRIAEVFVRPDRYDPERFAPGRAEDRKARFALITFGGGKHGCLGMTFAYLQVKAIWSVLLRRFRLELRSYEAEPNYATFVVGPKQPCWIRYRRRRSTPVSVPAHSPDIVAPVRS
jgi:sterol 14-demethylase